MIREKENTKVYKVYSPDGFTIQFEPVYYTSEEECLTAFENWKKGFVRQGYYSSNKGRIPLDELKEHCTFEIVED
jgi:hypothetical protein